MFGLITGSGFYDIPDLVDRLTTTIDTPFGSSTVTTGSWFDEAVAFVPRHGQSHSVPPADINYRANIWALREVGVDRVLATAVCGGMTNTMVPGTLVVISDFLNFTTGRKDTFFDGTLGPFSAAEHHTDMTDAYDPHLRELVLESARVQGIEVTDGGVYCTTNGPRFESPAEIEMMRRLGGDLVGMTGYPEVALAAEAGLAYCSIGVVSNPAAGTGPPLDIEEIFTLLDDVSGPLYSLISTAVRNLAT